MRTATEIRKQRRPARRSHRTKPRTKRVSGKRIRAYRFRECGVTSTGNETPKGCVAHRLLCLTERSYQRPGGAGTSTGRMDQSKGTHRWLGRMAECEASAGAYPVITQIVFLCNLCTLWTK